MASTPGEGTTFTITLPAAPMADAADAADTAGDAPDMVPGAVILVVDDEPAIRALAERILQRAGHTTMVAANGQAALEVARTIPVIDVLLTDLTMPNMGGVELAATLIAERPGLPVVYMSGYGEEQLAQDGVLPAGVRLLHKPFDVAALTAIVGEALATRD